MFHSTGEWGLCSAPGLPTPAPSSHPGYKLPSLGGRMCAGAGLGAAVLLQGSAGCSRARVSWTCLGCVCHLREAEQQLLTSPCFAWPGRTLFPSTLPEAVQTAEWAGRASQAKHSRRHPVGTSQAQHSWSGRVGIHAPAWLLSPAWCSAPGPGAGNRALNVVGKLPAVVPLCTSELLEHSWGVPAQW